MFLWDSKTFEGGPSVCQYLQVNVLSVGILNSTWDSVFILNMKKKTNIGAAHWGLLGIFLSKMRKCENLFPESRCVNIDGG